MSDVPVFANVELQLAGWTVSHQHGAKLTFWIAEEDLAAFKTLTARHGKIAGQRLGAAFVLIGDDEQPVRTEENTRQKGGPLSQLAGIWTNDEDFKEWISCRYPELMAPIAAEEHGSYSRVVAEAIRQLCGVTSRAEIDHDPFAKDAFNTRIREPYMQHLAEREERTEP